MPMLAKLARPPLLPALKVNQGVRSDDECRDAQVMAELLSVEEPLCWSLCLNLVDPLDAAVMEEQR